jgi:BlaI family penicillinase repressor
MSSVMWTAARMYIGFPSHPQNLAVTAVQQIIERLCGGSVEQLIVGMVDRELLDERELRRLAEKLARRKNRTRKGQDAG